MEWVETTGDTLEEAKNLALDQLGVAEDDAEFEIIEEPRPGLFGRTRGEARVRARVRPTTPRGKTERRDRNGRGERSDRGERRDGNRDRNGRDGNRDRKPRNESRSRDEAPRPPREKVDVDPAAVGAAAADFLNGLVSAFGTTGQVSVNREGEEIEVRVDGTELGLLVGPGGGTLLAIQDLTRVASQRRLGDQDTRLRVDIAGYRERRRAALGRFAEKVAEEVKATGSARRLEPMNSADRKIVHDTLIEFEGVTTRSEGEDPKRRVVVEPASAEF
jgi:spoIIIJ-associated protein